MAEPIEIFGSAINPVPVVPVTPVVSVSSAQQPIPMPSLPSGLPHGDATKPAWALTQDQIDFLVKFVKWPEAVKQYWPTISAILLVVSGITGMIGRMTAPVPVNPVPAAANDHRIEMVDPSKGMKIPSWGTTVEIQPPTIIAPANIRPVKLIIYLTDKSGLESNVEISKTFLGSYGITTAIDPKKYPEGSTLPVAGGKVISLPCAVLFAADGKMIDACRLDGAAVMGMIETHASKKK